MQEHVGLQVKITLTLFSVIHRPRITISIFSIDVSALFSLLKLGAFEFLKICIVLRYRDVRITRFIHALHVSFTLWHFCFFKVIGGLGPFLQVKLKWKFQSQGVSRLFTEWGYLTVLENYCNLNFQTFILSHCKISWKMAPKITYLEL